MKFLKILTALAALFYFSSCQNETHNFIIGEKDKSPTNEELFSVEEQEVLKEIARGTNRVSEEEAISRVMASIDLFGEELTRSGTQRTIKDSYVLTTANTPKTRSSSVSADTVAYIFNFENNMGFAIASADERIPQPVLAMAGEGYLGTRTDNPGLSIFLGMAEDYISESIAKAELTKDSLINSILEKLKAQDTVKHIYQTKGLDFEYNGDPIDEPGGGTSDYIIVNKNTSVGPWIANINIKPLTAVEWAQSKPYNANCPDIGCGNGDLPPTGCVATATAQIMAYWKYPAVVGGRTIDWANLVKYTDDPSRNRLFGSKWSYDPIYRAPTSVKTDVATLMHTIGINVGMDYGCKESGAKTENAMRWLKSIGYQGGEQSSYDNDRVISSLSNKRIVLAKGYSKKEKTKLLGITVKTSYKGGHAWNYDGWISRSQTTTTSHEVRNKYTYELIAKNTYPSIRKEDFVHVNWGWGGYQNGYYTSGVFDASVGKEPKKPSDENNNYRILSKSTEIEEQEDLDGTTGHYQYKLEIFTNIRK